MLSTKRRQFEPLTIYTANDLVVEVLVVASEPHTAEKKNLSQPALASAVVWWAGAKGPARRG